MLQNALTIFASFFILGVLFGDIYYHNWDRLGYDAITFGVGFLIGWGITAIYNRVRK